MKFEFLRKLAKDASEDEIKTILSVLQNAGIEIFVPSEDTYVNLTEAENYSGGYLYTSAADVAEARKLLEEARLTDCLCRERESEEKSQMSELEKAEADYFKKRKQQHMECYILIAAVLVFFILRYFFSK